MKDFVASIDVGTTNIKLNLFNYRHEMIDFIKFPHVNVLITEDVFELDFEEIWSHISAGLHQLIDQYQVTSLEIVLTTAMHSVQLVDDHFNLVGSMITWADNRGADVLSHLDNSVLEQQYYRTGTPMHPMNPFIKLLNLYDQSSLVGSLKDLLFYRLTNEWAIDVSNASSSGLYNLQENNWDKDALEKIGLSSKQLPQIKAIDYSLPINESILKGIEAVVTLGTSDGVSSNYVFKNLKDIAVLSVGTSHAIRIIHSEPKLDYSNQNFCYVIKPGEYLIGLPSNNGANVLAWANQVFNSTFDQLNEIASRRPETFSNFAPFLNGERAPIWDDGKMASLSNLSRRDSRESILFSIILGMVFNIKENVTTLSRQVPFEGIGLVGGVTLLAALPQLIADVLGYKLYIPKFENAETYGSLVATNDVRIPNDFQIVEPDMSQHERFEEMYTIYLKNR